MHLSTTPVFFPLLLEYSLFLCISVHFFSVVCDVAVTLLPPDRSLIFQCTDTPSNSKMLSMLLRKRGVVPSEPAENGEVAVDVMKNAIDHYDLIFMDYSMPIMVRTCAVYHNPSHDSYLHARLSPLLYDSDVFCLLTTTHSLLARAEWTRGNRHYPRYGLQGFDDRPHRQRHGRRRRRLP
jgi:hypothetical protein